MGDSNSPKNRIFHAGPNGDTRVEDVDPAPGNSPPLQEMTFATHVLSLNAMALMHLGEVEGMSEADRDLDAARHVVDTLAMLEEKTQGNLSKDEAGLLRAVMYDLRVKCLKT